MAQLALVTGAGSGIGQAVAIELGRCGYDVALLDVSMTGLKDTETKTTEASPASRISLHCVDVGNPGGIVDAVNSIHAEKRTISKVAACAGIFRPDGVTDPKPVDAAKVLAVNYNSVVNTLQATSGDLLKSKGAAVLIASAESHRAFAHMASYVSSKHAVLGYGRSIAAELAPLGVRVNIVCPGSTKTGMYDTEKMSSEMKAIAEEMEAKIPLRRIADPMEIARVVRFLLSEDASYMVGAMVPVDGGRTL